MALILQGRFRWYTEYLGKIIDAGVVPNGIVTNTIDDLMDTYFSAGSPAANWYLGLISDTNYDEDTGISADDTMASHDGWQEAENYTEGTRPPWAPEVSLDGLKKNVDFVAFTIDTVERLKGMFVTNDNEKGGVNGLLWAHGVFPTTNSPPAGSVFKLFYELEAREG